MKLFQAITTTSVTTNPKELFTCKHKKLRIENTEISEIIEKAREKKVFDFIIEDSKEQRFRIMITQSFEEKNRVMKIKLANSERRKFSHDEEVGNVKLVDQQNQIHSFIEAIV